MKNVEVSFYQLTCSPLEKALPPLLDKIYQKGLRVLVVVDQEERAAMLDSVLWTYSSGAFLPHARQGDPADNPIWLSLEAVNRNKADVLVMTAEEMPENWQEYSRCIDLFDGNLQGSLERATKRLAAYRQAGCVVQYWQQSTDGRWLEKTL